MKNWIEAFGGLKKLNTATKYPSIPTFHEIQGKGQLIGENFLLTNGNRKGSFTDKEKIYLYEKVDGTNSRIIQLPKNLGYLIGSREEILYAQGDYIENPQMSIVPTIKPLADSLPENITDFIKVWYMETFGHGIGKNGKQYTNNGITSMRLFDICNVDPEALKDCDLHKVSSWREAGEDSYHGWVGSELLEMLVRPLDAKPVPRLKVINGRDLPTTISGMMEFLETVIPNTLVALDESGLKQPEGLIARTHDRRVIAKIRYEDYQRTLKKNRR